MLRQKSPPCGISLSLIFYSLFKCNSFLGIKLTLHSKPGCPTFFSYDFWSNFFLLSFVKWVMDPLRKLFQIVNELKRCNVCLIFSICSYPEEQLKQVVFLLLCRSKEKKLLSSRLKDWVLFCLGKGEPRGNITVVFKHKKGYCKDKRNPSYYDLCVMSKSNCIKLHKVEI